LLRQNKIAIPRKNNAGVSPSACILFLAKNFEKCRALKTMAKQNIRQGPFKAGLCILLMQANKAARL